jgi:hypothetical protein
VFRYEYVEKQPPERKTFPSFPIIARNKFYMRLTGFCLMIGNGTKRAIALRYNAVKMAEACVG